MGISNYVPNSRISQAGVCTSTTRSASPYEGQVIYETDTNRVLVWEGSAWVSPNSQTANPPGLELVKTQTIGAGVSSVDVTSCFSADYDNYRAIIGIKGTAASAALYIRFLTGTTTVQTDNCYSVEQRIQYSVGTLAISTRGDQYIICGAVSNTGFSNYIVDFYSPNAATYTLVTMNGSYTRSATDGDFFAISSGNRVNTQLTGFEITTAGASNIDGTIRVYGYRN